MATVELRYLISFWCLVGESWPHEAIESVEKTTLRFSTLASLLLIARVAGKDRTDLVSAEYSPAARVNL